MEGHLDIITDIKQENDSFRFYTSSTDSSVKIWDERNGYLDSY